MLCLAALFGLAAGQPAHPDDANVFGSALQKCDRSGTDDAKCGSRPPPPVAPIHWPSRTFLY